MKINTILDKMIAEAIDKMIEAQDQFPMDGDDLDDMSDILGMNLNPKSKDAGKPEHSDEVMETIEKSKDKLNTPFDEWFGEISRNLKDDGYSPEEDKDDAFKSYSEGSTADEYEKEWMALKDLLEQWEKEENADAMVESVYFYDLITEVMGENFGASPFGGDGNLLQEAWDSGWPDQFLEMANSIKKWADPKGKNAEDIISKYFIYGLDFDHFGPYRVLGAYETALKTFAEDYFIGENHRGKALGVKHFIEDQDSPLSDPVRSIFKGWYSFSTSGDQMAVLRALNKLIKSLDKKVAKLFKDIGAPDLMKIFKQKVSKSINNLGYAAAAEVRYKLVPVLNFIHASNSDDNIKKLSSFYKKEMRNPGEGSLFERTNDWIAGIEFELNELPCEEAGLDDTGCILHKFDDGYFWYNLDKKTCKISGQKMNNCGQASRGLLVNLMSKSETGKYNWHVMVEYDPDLNEIVQVLGNSNTLPKKEYWDKIKWYYENKEKPIIDDEAWEYLSGNNEEEMDEIDSFLSYIGAGPEEIVVDSWEGMGLQIDEGFYNNDREEGDSWARQTFLDNGEAKVIEIDLALKMRIQVKEMLPKWREIDFPWLNRAAAGEDARRMVREVLFGAMPEDRIEFYPDTDDFGFGVDIKDDGFLEIRLIGNSVDLKENPDGSGQKTDDELENTRIKFIKFMSEIKRTFHAGFMYSIGDKVRDQLVKKAKKMKNKWDQDNQNLDEESQAILEELIKESRK